MHVLHIEPCFSVQAWRPHAERARTRGDGSRNVHYLYRLYRLSSPIASVAALLLYYTRRRSRGTFRTCILFPGSRRFVDLVRRSAGRRAELAYVAGGKKGSLYSITERRVPELIPVLGSRPAGDVSHKPGGRLPLFSTRPTVTLATLKRAVTNFAVW